MKKSKIIIVSILVLVLVVLAFVMPTLGKTLDFDSDDVSKIEISQDIYYLDDDSKALWTTVTDRKDIKKLVKVINRPFILKGFEPLAGGSRRKVVFFLTNGEEVELYLLEGGGVSVDGELYRFLFTSGGHNQAAYDDIDKIISDYEFSALAEPIEEVLAQNTNLWFIPGYKAIQSSDTVLTLTEPYPFDYLDVGTQTLINAVYYDNCLTVVFEGVKADGSEPKDSFGGSSDDSDNGLTLIVDGSYYPCTGYTTYQDERLMTYGMTCRFDLGDAMLSPDTEYTITFDRRENQNWYLEIPLTLKTAEHIDSMASIGEHYENEYVSVAVGVAVENDVLSAALYAVPKNGMELICIGGDAVSYASRGVVLLTGSNGEHIPSFGPYVVPKCYYPTVRNYDISGIDAAVLSIPCVLLRDKVNESISKSFQTREEALEYTETLELEHCSLTFEITEGKDGLEMTCSAESLSEGLNLRSVETADEPSSSWLDPNVIRFPRDSKPSEISDASKTLNESLSFSVDICGIIYEAETDFKINIELQND